MFIRIALILAAGSLALAHQTSPQVEKAREFLNLLLDGKFAEAVTRCSPLMQKSMPENVLRQAVRPLSTFGALQKALDPETGTADGLDIVVFPLIYEKMGVNVQITLTREGVVDGIFFRPRLTPAGGPPWQPPAYSRPDRFRAEDIAFGDGEWRLPGVLALPAGAGPFPGLVLVHGSGPNDRDETIGPNKPFRDLAEGLASRGIAVLRYDKRTRRYASKLAATKQITLDQETVDDAVTAARFLRERKEIDPRRVFILGHSLGGYAAPRIGARDPKLAGIVILAGNSRPLEDLILEQVTYALSLQSSAGPETKKKLDDLKQVVARVKGLKTGGELGPTDILAGAPASYWLDLKNYDPAGMASGLKMPLLVLQGERDYQVTMADFAGWKAALKSHGDATFKSYPALNHLFVEGQGKSKPSEYSTPAHVAEEVIGDVARWILKR